MIYLFLVTGFEEVEAIAPIDIFRRAGLPVTTVSITGELTVTGSHGIPVVADSLFEDNDYSDATLLFLPGGTVKIAEHEGLQRLILTHNDAGRPLAAICAAPMLLGILGLSEGKRMTCYPGFETYLKGAEYTAALVERDGLMFTGKGPAAALALGYAIVEHFCGKETAEQLKEGMMYNDL